jgi:hypothetical protein
MLSLPMLITAPDIFAPICNLAKYPSGFADHFGNYRLQF